VRITVSDIPPGRPLEVFRIVRSDEPEARRALEVIVRRDPGAAGDYAMLQTDDQGNPVGEALTGTQLNTAG
jgi:hypothetical protein